ncbi:hypothetical protein KXD40_002085 [Peronospora effusa]|uniref:Crinkler effector protein N-terminal domain-containing protein n=1 Tax=Peronospora effusa TaxID=542832 RepID=A0A3M6VE51_9STRA|nr:hypothetical protein DD238_003473 [Peronospora effusa]RQM18207.1 hypothetical protein DD237_000119 [Peronospora effusa]UIZ26243.1 hypothetical protein KXD40_002085 [Peronospora effusa]
MVTLLCAFVGTKGSVFPVHIDASQSVGHLKDAIKMDNQRRITCDANDLQLYPAKTKIGTAKTEDGKWLSSSTEDVKKLKEGEKTSHVVELTKEGRELQGEDSVDGHFYEVASYYEHTPFAQARKRLYRLTFACEGGWEVGRLRKQSYHQLPLA